MTWLKPQVHGGCRPLPTGEVHGGGLRPPVDVQRDDILAVATSGRGSAPPEKLKTYFYYYFDWKAEQHLRAMTREILKDTELKMRYADFIFASYGGKISPEADQIYSEVAAARGYRIVIIIICVTVFCRVGYLDSQIMKRFRYMCATYRDYTRIEDFMKNKFNEDDMLNGNHLIQSAYHEILVLKDLQNKALDKKEALQKKERAMQFFMEFHRKEKTYKPKQRSKGSRDPVRRQGDSRRNGVDMKKAEHKLKTDLRKKKWMEGHGMNDSVLWNDFKEVDGIHHRQQQGLKLWKTPLARFPPRSANRRPCRSLPRCVAAPVRATQPPRTVTPLAASAAPSVEAEELPEHTFVA
ncbi:hypothetical protein MSG28_015864 [Choristoneura fumiferana]|uniref:Uncharacterized protein n=1 Tax=Choristoneura fumiferana TaxID=7141 RepID=A0ACC0K4Q7_CHOFU|nr:hypothetical protein MSG28_015864 [Choristoneura fumiferana]